MINTHACITITCNVCGDPLRDYGYPDTGGTLHFDGLAEAIMSQADEPDEHRWLIRPDGYALCPDDDQSHASVRESLTPAEPQPQIPGQTEITTETGA